MNEQSYPLEMTVEEAAHRFHAGAELLDVREPMELDICKIPGSLDIPMGQIPGSLDSLSREGQLLVMCHHGARAHAVTAFLREQGFNNASNVAGGINAWAIEVDPEISRY